MLEAVIPFPCSGSSTQEGRPRFFNLLEKWPSGSASRFKQSERKLKIFLLAFPYYPDFNYL
jgi:hypothetical protein